MNDNDVPRSESSLRRVPWNKGKLPGAKPPLRPSHVWSIRTKLQLERRTRDLALFNLAIDSKLRGCDVVAIRVEDVAPNGYTLDRATVLQRKTGRPVRFEITEQTRQAIDDYLRLTERQPGRFLFAGRCSGETRSLTTRQYARSLVRQPAGSDKNRDRSMVTTWRPSAQTTSAGPLCPARGSPRPWKQPLPAICELRLQPISGASAERPNGTRINSYGESLSVDDPPSGWSRHLRYRRVPSAELPLLQWTPRR